MRRLLTFIAVLVCFAPSFSLGNNNLIVGGKGSFSANWEIRDTNSGLVSSGATWASRSDHCAVRVSNGNVLFETAGTR